MTPTLSLGDKPRTCGAAGCIRPIALDVGGCERCLTVFCTIHKTCPTHKCSREPLDDDEWLSAQHTELKLLESKINWPALLTHASKLAGGKTCHIDEHDDEPLGRKRTGGMHAHRVIRFDDGTTWLARIVRERYDSPTAGDVDTILASEYATLYWLQTSGCGIPAPRVYGFGLSSDPRNAVGVAYILMEEMPGRPFDMASAPDNVRARVLEQWADMLLRLSKHPFSAIGSLTMDMAAIRDGHIVKNTTVPPVCIGPVASDRTGTLPLKIGPFSSASAFYSAWAKSYQELVVSGQLFSDYADEAAHMFGHIVKRLGDPATANGWLSRHSQWQALDSSPFFLKHMDDKGDHLMVDDEGTIVGIIDWTYARIVPAYEAFGPSLFSADNDKLFNGFPGLSASDKVIGNALNRLGAPYNFFSETGTDSTDYIRQLLFGLGTGMGFSRDEARASFAGLCFTFEGRRLDVIYDKGVDRFADCSWHDCPRPSLRNRGCASCRRRGCAVHALGHFHATCTRDSDVSNVAWDRAIDDEVAALLEKINVPALIEVASSLRNGISCVFVPGIHRGLDATMGCANYHATLVFDDSVRWIVRIPRLESANATLLTNVPDRIIEYVLASEYATLLHLEQVEVDVGGIRKRLTPRVYGYGLASDVQNRVGISYLLQDAIPGRPFDAHGATPEQRQHVYAQYAAFLAAVATKPRNQACSLSPVPLGLSTMTRATTAAPLASDRFLRLGTSTGPFTTALDYFMDIASTHMALVADGQLHTAYPREAFLFYQLLRDDAALALASQCVAHEFYLKHVDDKGDHILVDDNFAITGIIDWQYARFVPSVEAFGPSLVTADLDALYGGVPGTSADDGVLGAALGDVYRPSDLVRRFHFGLASGLSRSEALSMIQAVRKLVPRLDDTGVDGDGDIEAWLATKWAAVASQHPESHAKIEALLRAMHEVNSE